jgi:hypothetical protein
MINAGFERIAMNDLESDDKKTKKRHLCRFYPFRSLFGLQAHRMLM